MNYSNPDVVILHLSDFHFGPYLQGVSRIGEWSSFAPPHDFNLLQGMETIVKVTKITEKYKDRLIVAVTGDMTTAAEPPAYESFNNYLRDNPFVSWRNRVGLELQKSRIYIVPGNHDVWLYGNFFTRWEGYSNRRDQYFKYFPQQLPNAYPLFVNGTSITIYTIDTNRIESFNPFNFKNVLGRGKVGKTQIGEIQTLHNSLLQGTFENAPKDFDYASSLKIAIMHHHLGLPSNKSKDFEQKLLELGDATSVLNLLCEIKVHIVLCGHQHFPYHIPEVRSPSYNNRSVFLSCAGSATQIECKKNSFSYYEITNNHDGTYKLYYSVYEADAENKNYFFKESVRKTFEISDDQKREVS
jgi:hypothetical protein